MKKSVTRKVSRETTKIEKRINKIAPFISIAIGVSLALFAFIRVCMFFDAYSIKWQLPFRTPVTITKRPVEKIHSPLAVEAKDRKTSPTPTPIIKIMTEKELVLSTKHGEQLWKIYQLESQRGKEDWCRNNNLGYGGFGIKVDNKIVCYPTFQKAVERAEYWIVDMGIDKNLVNALCTWNLGFNRIKDANGKEKIIPHTNCGYYQNYLAVVM